MTKFAAQSYVKKHAKQMLWNLLVNIPAFGKPSANKTAAGSKSCQNSLIEIWDAFDLATALFSLSRMKLIPWNLRETAKMSVKMEKLQWRCDCDAIEMKWCEFRKNNQSTKITWKKSGEMWRAIVSSPFFSVKIWSWPPTHPQAGEKTREN